MTRNQNLCHVLKGRTIASSTIAGSLLTTAFADGSSMTATITMGWPVDIPTKTVAVVYQDGPDLQISFDDGTTTDIALDPGSSNVLVRSASGTLEYVG